MPKTGFDMVITHLPYKIFQIIGQKMLTDYEAYKMLPVLTWTHFPPHQFFHLNVSSLNFTWNLKPSYIKLPDCKYKMQLNWQN